MTATTATTTARRGPGSATRAPARPFPLETLGEAALVLVSLATALGLRRLFTGADWLWPMALNVVIAHGLAIALRRRGVSTAGAVLMSAVAALLMISWTYAGAATTYGFPTGATIEALSDSVSSAFSEFSEVKAPTEAFDGFLIASTLALWLCAVVGDWAAFRAGASVEAVLPAATLFGLASVLGGDVQRVALSGVWIGAVLAFVLFRRAARIGRESTWVGDRDGRGPRNLVLVGVGLAAVATLIAGLVGPRLPGAESDGIVSLTEIGDGGPGTRVTVSPLVDIRSRLVSQADVEVFTVRSNVRSYWRLTSLDRFDGSIWSSNGSYGKTSGNLDEGVPVASARIPVDQQFQIRALSQIWLPAAYEPRQVAVGQAVRYDEVSGTLIVDTEVPTSDGSVYGVRSLLPQHHPDLLATAGNLVPADIAERYLGLPEDFSPRARQLATDLTAGSTSAYEAALRLQNFFRDEFTYDLGVGPGHSGSAIENFLFDDRRGYCEQFAGSFAAMARSIGLPARVAVGFTPGNVDPDDPNLYRVRGEHAHAWPEVYLGDAGWVAFEPTPGRGAPFSEQYTGVPEQQVESGGDPSTATTNLTPPSTEVLVPTEGGPSGPAVPDLGSGSTVDTTDEESPPNPWFGRIAWAAGILVALVALYLLLVLAVTTSRRARRRRAATTAEAQIALAWDESLESIRRVGVPVRPAETQRQTAARVGTRLPAIDTSFRSLATTVQDATYSPDGPDLERGSSALALAASIDQTVTASMAPGDRFRDRFHPRQLRRR